MKKLIIMSALVMGGLGVKTADAQFAIRVNLNLGAHPVYAPAPEPEVINEPVYDDYYYLPEVEAYYSVGEHSYYYNDGERWISAAYLPGRYHDFDWRTARRFEVRTSRPYLHHDVYRGRFGGYVNRNDYYARAYPNRGREQYDNRGGFNRHDEERGREQNDNRGGWNRDNDRNQNDNNQGRNQGGYGQPDRNQGGYSQPDRNQGGYNQPNQNQGGNQSNPGRNQGGYSQPAQNQGGQQQQPSQGQGQQGGSRGNGQGQGQNQGNGNGQSQPSRNGGQNSGASNGASHYAANQMGVIQDRNDLGRPVRQ